MNKKIMLSGISILAAVSLMVGATYAYFTAQETSANNTFTAGTLEVLVLDQNGTDTDLFENEILASAWAPGEQTIVQFDVKNSGSLPVNLMGNATGSWSNPLLNPAFVKVVKIERFDGSGWVTILNAPAGVTGNFYYSPDGSNASLYELGAGERAQLRLTVEFDSSANNDYQGQTFYTSIEVNAKQTNASW